MTQNESYFTSDACMPSAAPLKILIKPGKKQRIFWVNKNSNMSNIHDHGYPKSGQAVALQRIVCRGRIGIT